MSEKCPVCKIKKPGLCIHEKMMLGMLGVVGVVGVIVALILIF